MSIDFQNGFICGMATKGMIKSGNPYEPVIYNDEGVYDYFYIDFKQSVESFSLGMLDSSVIVMSSGRLALTNTKRVSPSVFRVYCDISDSYMGIVVLNKKTGYLRFSNGKRMPAFSVHAYIRGLAEQIDLGYFYDEINFDKIKVSSLSESGLVTLSDNSVVDEIFETTTYKGFAASNVTENATVVLV